MRDTDNLLETRNQVINELEREAKQKERILAERQEQLSVLLSAMESYQTQRPESGRSKLSTDEDSSLRQKVANLAAELCSMKAVESQMERKASDAAHRENKLQGAIKKMEADNAEHHNASQDY
jgi:hypothetical protein